MDMEEGRDFGIKIEPPGLVGNDGVEQDVEMKVENKDDVGKENIESKKEACDNLDDWSEFKKWAQEDNSEVVVKTEKVKDKVDDEKESNDDYSSCEFQCIVVISLQKNRFISLVQANQVPCTVRTVNGKH